MPNQIVFYPQSSPGAVQLIEALSASGTSVTFSNIPQTFTHLKLVANVISNNGGVDTLELQFNGDSSFNYSRLYTLNSANNNTGTVSSSQTATANFLTVGAMGTDAGSNEITIAGYAQSGLTRSAIGQGIAYQGNSAQIVSGGGVYVQTNPVTSITLLSGSGSGFAGGTFSLYGYQ